MKETAILAAREAGKLMLDWRQALPPGPAAVDYKSAKDVVTVVDKQAEDLIISHIRAKFPEHAILGEEGGLLKGSAESPYTWVIDPLDGTANYAADLAASCVSIGVLDGNTPVLGVVYNPFRDELFVGIKGGGAFLNDQPIRVSREAILEKSLMAFDLGYNEERAIQQLREAAFWRSRVRTMRILGSAVLALCYVACGRFDLFYHGALHAWDLAAAAVILEEAGAITSNHMGEPLDIYQPSVVTGNPEMHRLYFEVRKQFAG
ncbi:MAG: inositol monophosphatase [Chloroflexi bacterium]|uniref:Inositol-1-monophosphatase n=1 Tax=Candidatus Chlorohelix allophototropha TaxID=3003348 RepID=A0A8T7M9Y1_9CHLR|nr:inositol monophosphatase [Chloroflexota bacterium]WJW68806.1 inositol monophosphatase [Chloroflexota bacterium L227-S17]